MKKLLWPILVLVLLGAYFLLRVDQQVLLDNQVPFASSGVFSLDKGEKEIELSKRVVAALEILKPSRAKLVTNKAFQGVEGDTTIIAISLRQSIKDCYQAFLHEQPETIADIEDRCFCAFYKKGGKSVTAVAIEAPETKNVAVAFFTNDIMTGSKCDELKEIKKKLGHVTH